MNYKEMYYQALVDNNDQFNEIDLGLKIGLNENETRAIITTLLSEYKIEYVENKVCDYVPIKKRR